VKKVDPIINRKTSRPLSVRLKARRTTKDDPNTVIAVKNVTLIKSHWNNFFISFDFIKIRE